MPGQGGEAPFPVRAARAHRSPRALALLPAARLLPPAPYGCATACKTRVLLRRACRACTCENSCATRPQVLVEQCRELDIAIAVGPRGMGSIVTAIKRQQLATSGAARTGSASAAGAPAGAASGGSLTAGGASGPAAGGRSLATTSARLPGAGLGGGGASGPAAAGAAQQAGNGVHGIKQGIDSLLTGKLFAVRAMPNCLCCRAQQEVSFPVTFPERSRKRDQCARRPRFHSLLQDFKSPKHPDASSSSYQDLTTFSAPPQQPPRSSTPVAGHSSSAHHPQQQQQQPSHLGDAAVGSPRHPQVSLVCFIRADAIMIRGLAGAACCALRGRLRDAEVVRENAFCARVDGRRARRAARSGPPAPPSTRRASWTRSPGRCRLAGRSRLTTQANGSFT